MGRSFVAATGTLLVPVFSWRADGLVGYWVLPSVYSIWDPDSGRAADHVPKELRVVPNISDDLSNVCKQSTQQILAHSLLHIIDEF